MSLQAIQKIHNNATAIKEDNKMDLSSFVFSLGGKNTNFTYNNKSAAVLVGELECAH